MDTPFTYGLSDLQITLKKSLATSIVQRKSKQSAIWSAITFLGTTIGIGFLSLPLACAYSGMTLYSILILLTAILMYHSSFALVSVGQKLKAKNYPLLVSKVLNSKICSFPFHLMMFLNLFGTILTYTIAIQQSLSETFVYIGSLCNYQFPNFIGKLNSTA